MSKVLAQRLANRLEVAQRRRRTSTAGPLPEMWVEGIRWAIAWLDDQEDSREEDNDE